VRRARNAAKIETSASAIAIGEPFEITFVVEHETGASVKLPEPECLAAGVRTHRRSRSPCARSIRRPSAVTTTRARWRVHGARRRRARVPALDIGVDGGGVNQMLHAGGPKLAVAHATEGRRRRAAAGTRIP
jgi:hypothetical protein